MINLLIGIGFLATITVFWTAFFGSVTVLPWGLDEVLQIFMTQINLVIHILPPFETIWNVFIIAMGVKFSLLIMEYVIVIIRLIRG